MAQKSPIEWTDVTWNPVTGCTKKSQGCKNCYAETMYERFNGKGLIHRGWWCENYSSNSKTAVELSVRVGLNISVLILLRKSAEEIAQASYDYFKTKKLPNW